MAGWNQNAARTSSSATVKSQSRRSTCSISWHRMASCMAWSSSGNCAGSRITGLRKPKVTGLAISSEIRRSASTRHGLGPASGANAAGIAAAARTPPPATPSAAPRPPPAASSAISLRGMVCVAGASARHLNRWRRTPTPSRSRSCRHGRSAAAAGTPPAADCQIQQLASGSRSRNSAGTNAASPTSSPTCKLYATRLFQARR